MVLKVQVKTPPKINTDIKRVQVSLAKLEELKDVEVNELEDGQTLVYDADAEKWVAQSVIDLTNIDGGSY
jgi:hypothetical protein